MIDPVTASAVLLGGCRLVASAEQVSARRAGEREQRELAGVVRYLPPGCEVGEVRADGSYWWIRVPSAPAM